MSGQPKTLADSKNWEQLVKNIGYTIGANYEWSEGEEERILDKIIEEFDHDIPKVIHLATKELEPAGEFEQKWSWIKAAAILLNTIWGGRLGNYSNPKKYSDTYQAQWRVAERCGVGSYTTLTSSDKNDLKEWQKQKFTLDSIIFTLVNLDRGPGRMDRFFNSKLSDYWKSYYVDWDILWEYVAPGTDYKKIVEFFDSADYRKNHKFKFYNYLTYRLEYHATEFSQDQDKVLKALDWFSNHPDDIPNDLPLRKRIYSALSSYLRAQAHDDTIIFNEIFKVLQYDAIDFILSDPTYEAGKVLLNSKEILEETWETNKSLQEEILPAILTAMDHNDEQVQKKAKEFLKKRAPSEIQEKLEGLINKLNSTSGAENVSSLIANLIEFGSEMAIKTVLKRCVVWIATDENWSLVERAAQKLQETPSAIQALIYQLNIGLDDSIVQEKIREQMVADQNVYPLKDLFGSDRNGTEQSDKRPIDRFNELNKDIQHSYAATLEDWALSFEGRSKDFADQISAWRERLRDDKDSNSETIHLAGKILDLLVSEKLEENKLEVQRWIAALLSHMSDPRFYDKDSETYTEIKRGLEKFAIESLSKRLPNEDDLELRESFVRVLGNIGGSAAVDGLVRTITSNERERKARQELLAEYYLKPSKQRSEEAAGYLKDAVQNAKDTMRLLQILNTATFILGAAMLIGGVIVAVVNNELGTRLVGFLSGLGGLGAIVSIFLRDPLRAIQNAMGDLVQVQTAFTGFVWDLNLNGTYIQSQYVAAGTLTDYDVRETSSRIAVSVEKTMDLIQMYAEGEFKAGPPHLNDILSPGKDGTLAIFGRNLSGQINGSRKTKLQIAINHKSVDANIKSWTDHFMIINISPTVLKAAQTDGAPLWLSVKLDDVESNLLPFNFVD